MTKRKQGMDPLTDLFSFAREVLGYNLLGSLHLAWYEAIFKHPFVLLLSPRSHLKSTAVTVSYTLWRLAHNHNLRILILNEVLPNAQNFLREIKEHITSNPRFRERFGALDAAATKWTETSIVVPRPRIMKEPSIAVCGVLGTVVSMHPDLIILDDPIALNNSQTSSQRSKVSHWFRNVVLPMLEPSGQIITIGTRYHYADLYSEILTDPGFANWHKIIQKAEWLDEAGERHFLFPERFSPEKLDELKRTMGSAAFNCQMLNDPSGQEGSDFKAAWLEQGRYEQLPDRPTVFSGVDLAIGRSESNSRFAIVTIAHDRDGTVFVVNAYRDRIPFAEQLKAVKRIHKLHHPRLITVEANGYQSVFIETLRTDPETRLLPLRPVNTQGDKHARLRGLAPLFESGAIRLPRREVGAWVEQIEEELLQFPRAQSDDMLDALWIALQAVEAQRTEPRIWFTDDIPERDYSPSKPETRSCFRCGGPNKPSAIVCNSCGRRLGWDD
ncbi:MAG: phage terminase large subunit [Elusimicrobia bacterium]|nr:phage terminase large subunit [Elusimicrobiota bacterium]